MLSAIKKNRHLLRFANPIYRKIDTRNPTVRNKLMKYEGVDEFLRLVGYEPDPYGSYLVCPAQQPPICVIEDGVKVLNAKLGECQMNISFFSWRHLHKTCLHLLPSIVSEKKRNIHLFVDPLFKLSNTFRRPPPGFHRKDHTLWCPP